MIAISFAPLGEIYEDVDVLVVPGIAVESPLFIANRKRAWTKW